MPKSKNNTAGHSKRLGKLIKSIRQKAENNENLIKALNKVLHFTKLQLLEFLGIKKFVSKFFQKTKTFTISQNPESFLINKDSIKEFLGKVIKREMNLKNMDPSIDDDLWRYFDGKIVPGIIKNFTVTIYRFLSNLIHRQILEEAENTGIKKVYSYLEGLSIICKVILSDEVDTKGMGVIVYFKIDDVDTSLYRFYAYRSAEGQLDFSVAIVSLDLEWDTNNGVCFND